MCIVQTAGDKVLGQHPVSSRRPAGKTYAQCLSTADMPLVQSTTVAEVKQDPFRPHPGNSDFQPTYHQPLQRLAESTLEESAGSGWTSGFYHTEDSYGLSLMQKAPSDGVHDTISYMDRVSKGVDLDKGGMCVNLMDSLDIPISMPIENGAGVMLPHDELPLSAEGVDEDTVPEAMHIVLRMVEELMSGEEEMVPNCDKHFNLNSYCKIPNPAEAQQATSVFPSQSGARAQCMPNNTGTAPHIAKPLGNQGCLDNNDIPLWGRKVQVWPLARHCCAY
jgi:hypothetical protein